MSPKTCSAIPASANAVLGPDAFRRMSAAATIAQPEASNRNPAILMSLGTVRFEYRFTLLWALFIGPIEIFNGP